MINAMALQCRNIVGYFAAFLILQLFLSLPSCAEETLNCSKGMDVRAVTLDDGWALMKNDGTILTDVRFGVCDEFIENVTVCGNMGSRKGWVYLSPEGQIILRVDNALADNFSEGLAAATTQNGLWGYIDRKGEWAISPKFGMALEFHE
jgi:hypothetical protein